MAEYNDYYLPQVMELQRRYKEASERPIEPMYSPEEAAKRKAINDWQERMGGLGAISNDKAVMNLTEPLLKQALEARKPRVTDHGQFDPLSGSFKYFPQVRQQLDTERIEKQLEQTQRQQALARQKWESDRQRAEEQQSLRAFILANKPAGAEPGSISWVGTDDKGMPIYNHSKHGLVVPAEGGGFQPHTGKAPGPKLNEPSDTTKTAYLKNNAQIEQVKIARQAVENNPSAVGVVGWLPDIARQYADKIPGVPTEAGSGGVGVRALVGDIGSMKVHDRSGAAVSASEVPRLRPFIPDVSRDNPETIKDKLKNFQMQYEIMARELEQGYPLSHFMQKQTPTSVTQIPGINAPSRPITGAPAGPSPMAPGVPRLAAPMGDAPLSPQELQELEQRRGASRQGQR